jgi:hypothetical protein
MPRPRTTKSNLSQSQLEYLAGIFDSTLGMRGVGTSGAAAISNDETWPKFMAETYGGTHSQFTSNKGRAIWGWYITINRRLELVKLLQEANVCHSVDLVGFDQIKSKLEKSINSGHGDEGGGPTA